MKTLARDHWSIDVEHELGPLVTLHCPSCGRDSTLSYQLEGHGIALDGAVTPSVVCPFRDCSFHEFVRLEGWEHPQPIAHRRRGA